MVYIHVIGEKSLFNKFIITLFIEELGNLEKEVLKTLELLVYGPILWLLFFEEELIGRDFGF